MAMATMRNSRRRLIAFVVVVGIALSAYVTAQPYFLEAVVSIPASSSKRSPLHCQVVLIDTAERKADLEQWRLFQNAMSQLRAQNWPSDYLGLLSPRYYNNPLIASSHFCKVQLENTSERDIAIYMRNSYIYETGARIENSQGESVTFEHHCVGTNKWLRPQPGLRADQFPQKTIAPGEVVTECLDLFNRITTDSTVHPGIYTIRAVCSYTRVPDAEDCEVESAPFTVTVTADHIRDWKAIHAVRWNVGSAIAKP
jgi:hypothetical protein